MRGAPRDVLWTAAAAAFFGVFLFSAWLSVVPGNFNVRTALRVNDVLQLLPGKLAVVVFLLTTPELQGVVVVALMWGAWFAHPDDFHRSRMIAGLAGALAAAILAHFLQHSFPSGQKPIFLPDFRLPEQLRPFLGPFDPAIMSGHSFPSERGTLFAGLALVTALAERRTGFVALVFTIVVEIARVLVGLHYAADVVGSVSLAAACVFVSSSPAPARAGRIVLGWEKAAPSSFYAAAFLIAYELLTTFDGFRWGVSMILRMFPHT